MDQRLHELELFRAEHEPVLKTIPAINASVVELRIGVERLSTTVRNASWAIGILLSMAEALHWVQHGK
jgi:uncharacterized coiled-coil protein SlyX